MGQQLISTDFDAVVGLYNVETLDRRQEICNRTIGWPETSRPISAKWLSLVSRRWCRSIRDTTQRCLQKS